MLAKCRETANHPANLELPESDQHGFSGDSVVVDEHVQRGETTFEEFSRTGSADHGPVESRDESSGRIPERKPITEVLHDIYDKKVH